METRVEGRGDSIGILYTVISSQNLSLCLCLMDLNKYCICLLNKRETIKWFSFLFITKWAPIICSHFLPWEFKHDCLWKKCHLIFPLPPSHTLFSICLFPLRSEWKISWSKWCLFPIKYISRNKYNLRSQKGLKLKCAAESWRILQKGLIFLYLPL